VKDLNVLDRQGHIVNSYNYRNSQQKFEEFALTGLSVFDFYSHKMYKEQKDD